MSSMRGKGGRGTSKRSIQRAAVLSVETLEGRQLFAAGDLLGTVTTAAVSGFRFDYRSGSAVQADGKIVIGGYVNGSGTGQNFAVVRYQSDGTTVDTSFGSGGIATLPLAGDQVANAIAVDGNGRVVVAGTSVDSGGNRSFAAGRFTATGGVDGTFGTGGVVTTDFFTTGLRVSRGFAIAIRPTDNKVLVGGSAFNPSTNRTEFALARYNANGTLDGTFSGDGLTTTNAVAGNSDEITDIALQSDGKIIVSGTNRPSVAGSGTTFALARYTSGGALDATFGTGGVVSTTLGASSAEAAGVAVLADGSIVGGGHVSSGGVSNFAVARYTASGSQIFATTFDVGGSGDRAGNVAVQTLDGVQKIVISGSTSADGGSIAVARLNLAGTLDTTFSGDGIATATGAPLVGRVPGLATQSLSGPYASNLVAAGVSTDASDADTLYLARFDGQSATTTASPTTVWVNDNWSIVTDVGSAGLSFGDTVTSNAADTGNSSGISGIFGVDAFASFQAAIDAVQVGGEVLTLRGTYTEDFDITKGLTLRSLDGKTVTTLTGVGTGFGGAIAVANGVTGVTVGGVNQGFTLNGTGFQALYIGSGVSNLVIRGNTINAADGTPAQFQTGIETTYNASSASSSLSNATIDDNVFGNTTGVADVLVYINPNAANVNFTNNAFSGNATSGLLITDATASAITGNSFTGVANVQLGVSAGGLTITGNTFGGDLTSRVDARRFGASAPAGSYSPEAIYAANTFLTAAKSTTGGVDRQALWANVQGAINASVGGDAVAVKPGTYLEDVTVNKTLTVIGSGVGSSILSGPIGGGGGTTVSIAASNVEVAGFTITRQGNNVTDWNNPGLNSAGLAIQGTSLTGATIRDNLITGNRSAIDVNNSSGHTIRNNVITANHTGMIFRNQTDNLLVTENAITDNRTVGILFLDASTGTNSPVQTAANSVFFNNNISGNWYGQIVDRQAGGSLPAPGTNVKNFSGNWFGTNNPTITTANSAEPGYASLIPVAFGGTATPPGGQPTIAGAGSANFDISPYLNAGTDTNVETTAGRGTYGFQGSFASLHVVAVGSQAGSLGRIQEGINLVTAAGTVNVKAGTYVENPTANKAVTLTGANAGTAGSSGSRVAETIIRTNGNQSAILTIASPNVTVDGFTLDGDDASVSGIALASGDDTNVAYGVQVSGAQSGVSLKNTIVSKVQVGFRGDGVATGNSVSRNWFDSVGRYDFGYAVTLRTNYYADVTDNKMTRVWSGLHTNNMNTAVGPATWTMSGNDVRSYAGGLLYWLQYNGATGLTVANNQFAAETGAVANNFGILAVSIQDAVAPSFTGNTITGTDYGIGLFNVPTSSTLSFGATNSVSGTKLAGLLLTNNLNFNPVTATNFLAGGPGAASTVQVNGMSISAATGAGVRVDSTGGTTQTVNVSGATVTGTTAGTTVGLDLVGASSVANLSGSNLSGFTTNIASVGSLTASGNTLGAATNGIVINGGSASITNNTIQNATTLGVGAYVGGVTLTGNSFTGPMTTDGKRFDGAAGYASQITSIYGANSFGTAVTVRNTANTYLPSIWANVQGGVNAAAAGDLVHAYKGVYNEHVTVAKNLTLEGAQVGVDARSRIVPVAQESVVTDGIAVSDGVVTIDGFTVSGRSSGEGITVGGADAGWLVQNNIIRDNVVGISELASNGTITKNLIDDNNRTGSANGTGIYNDFVVNGVTITQNRLTGHSVDGGSAINLISTTNSVVTNNQFDNNGKSVIAFANSNLQISNNLTTNSQLSAVVLGGGNSGVTITGNTFTDGKSRVVSVLDEGYGYGANSGVAVTANTINQNVAGLGALPAPGTVSLVASSSTAGAVSVSDNSFNLSGSSLPANVTEVRAIDLVSSSGTNTVATNVISGNGALGTVGIVVQGGAATLTLVNNSLTGLTGNGSESGGRITSVAVVTYEAGATSDTIDATGTSSASGTLRHNTNQPIGYTTAITTLNLLGGGGVDTVRVLNTGNSVTSAINANGGGQTGDALIYETSSTSGAVDYVKYESNSGDRIYKSTTASGSLLEGQLVNWSNFTSRRIRTHGGDDDVRFRALIGSAARDYIIETGDGADYVSAGTGNDEIRGGNGNDNIVAGNGDDMIFGEADNDTIFGGIGNDVLDGGIGSNQLSGQNGNDVIYARNGFFDSVDGGTGIDSAQIDVFDGTSGIETFLA